MINSRHTKMFTRKRSASNKERSSNTIIGVPYSAEQQQSRPPSSLLSRPDDADSKPCVFKIRLASDRAQLKSASVLIRRRYDWRGYKADGVTKQGPDFITLVASHGDETLATLSVGLDSMAGLLADELYPDQVQVLRRLDYRLCEFVKLAVDASSQSKALLATLFHVAFIYAKKIHGRSHVLIEVNPRHVNFYKAALGFEAIGDPRLNPRVDAPAVLMLLDLEHAADQIKLLGGRRDLRRRARSIYPYICSPEEEECIRMRLLDVECAESPATPI